MDFVALDFETANEKRSSPCAVGVVVVNGGQLVESRSWLIDPPGRRFSRFNVAIHGITPEDVEGELRFDELWPTLSSYLLGNTVLAHNAVFDMHVLKGTLDYYGIACPDLDYACSLGIARRTWPGLASYSLGSLADFLAIRFRHHDAAEDAEACAKVALHACLEMGSGSLRELMELLSLNTRNLRRRTGLHAIG